LVRARLLGVGVLAGEGQDRLRPPVAPALRSAAGRVTLHDVELTEGGISFGAVGELAGQRAGLEQALALDEVARLARRFAGTCRGQRFLDDAAALGRVLPAEP